MPRGLPGAYFIIIYLTKTTLSTIFQEARSANCGGTSVLKIKDEDKIQGNAAGTAAQNRPPMEANWAKFGDKISRDPMPDGGQVIIYGYRSLVTANPRRILHYTCFNTQEETLIELVDIIQDQPEPGSSGIARWAGTSNGGTFENGILLDLKTLLKECMQQEKEDDRLAILEKALVDKGELLKASPDPEGFVTMQAISTIDSFSGTIEIIGELDVSSA